MELYSRSCWVYFCTLLFKWALGIKTQRHTPLTASCRLLDAERTSSLATVPEMAHQRFPSCPILLLLYPLNHAFHCQPQLFLIGLSLCSSQTNIPPHYTILILPLSLIFLIPHLDYSRLIRYHFPDSKQFKQPEVVGNAISSRWQVVMIWAQSCGMTWHITMMTYVNRLVAWSYGHFRRRCYGRWCKILIDHRVHIFVYDDADIEVEMLWGTKQMTHDMSIASYSII